MLQSRGQVTAAEVAEELEISERTARRDLEALGMAGLPIYSRQGRNGGWQLAGGGRTDLSGLNAAEARALFLVAGPASSATPELRAALRKLVRALPESFRTAAEAATTSVLVDPLGLGRAGTEADACAPRRRAAGGRQRRTDRARLRRPRWCGDDSCGASARPRGERARCGTWSVTPKRACERSASTACVSRVERPASHATGRLRPARGVEAHLGGSREQAHADQGDRARHPGLRADVAMGPRHTGSHRACRGRWSHRSRAARTQRAFAGGRDRRVRYSVEIVDPPEVRELLA